METYFTVEELAKYLGYAEKTIRKWVLNTEIPFHKIHNSIRFRLSEIEKWIDTAGIYSAEETSEEKTDDLCKATEIIAGGQGGDSISEEIKKENGD